jgi:hypothetical protein
LLQLVSCGSKHTLPCSFDFTQVAPVGQSADVTQGVWQRPKLHTKLVEQSLLSTQPSESTFLDELLEQANASKPSEPSKPTNIAQFLRRLGRKRSEPHDSILGFRCMELL